MFAASKTDSASTGGYQISRSLRFNSADSAYLSRTPASAGNQQKWTWSGWVKRSDLSNAQQIFACRAASTPYTLIYFETSGSITFADSSVTAQYTWTAQYRDPAAWYHIVLAVDTTQATASNRLKLYVNNVLDSKSAGTDPTQNANTNINSTNAHAIGSGQPQTTNYFTGYMTEVNFIDGQALTPSSFGETNAQTGVWQPKAYSGSYGTNGFYLNFSDNSNTTAATLGKDYSGNGNNWTPNNFSVTAGSGNDSLVDSPTSYGTDTGVGGTVRGNYCTWNPLDKNNGSGALTNGNLDATDTNTAGTSTGVRSTLGGASGKWYFEATLTAGSNAMIGVSDLNKPLASAGWGSLNAWTYYQTTGNKYGNGTDSAYGATYTTNDVIGVAFDADAGTITFYKNGTSQGTAYTGLTGKTLSPYFGTASGTSGFTINAGQRPFAYTAPSGFKALCTQNLPTPTIGATTATQAGKFFNPVLYTGTSAVQTITGVGFQPDFSWIKVRNAADNHYLFDAVRGKGATYMKTLYSNATNAESPGNSTSLDVGVTDFASDGFTFGSGTLNGNQSPYTFVAWNWKANGSGSTNTAGSITSTVSANTTSGFSVVTYTGTGTAATIGHGLGVAPSMLIFKSRTNGSENWNVYHKSLGTSNNILLNTSGSAFNDTAFINNTAPTSTVLSVGGAGSTGTNAGSNTYVCYAFAEVAGYSKMGSWTGTGSGTGPFIYTGFRPTFVLVKNTTSSGPQWWILDNKRNVYNPEDLALPTSLSLAEQTIPTCLNFLSNGFQITTTNGDFNTSGSNYIYMAIAENPFKYSLAR